MKFEPRSLILGLIAGIAFTSTAGFVWYQRHNPQATIQIETETGPAEISRAPSAAGAAVQLTSEEQQAIGLQTSEVKEESFDDEIVTSGRIEELPASIRPPRGALPADVLSIAAEADVFESDIARIRLAISVEITGHSLPGKIFRGTVVSIEGNSDPQARTTRVWIQVENPGRALRRGMLVRASFRIPIGNVVTVPRSAVIDTGAEKIAFVAKGDGIFESRTIVAGAPAQNRYPILEGLRPGERVVTNGAFMVDSQTRLTGGMTGLFGGSKSFSEAQAPAAGSTAPTSSNKVSFRIDPDPPVGGRENTVHVRLTDADGKTIADAQVHMTLVMPAMPAMKMPEMRSGADLRWNGKEYTGPISVSMAGPWNVVVEARRGAELLATYRSHLEAR